MHFKLGVSHCISAFLCVSLVFLSRLPVLHAAWLPSPLAFTTWAEVPVYARACIRPSTVALHLPRVLTASGTNRAPGEAGCNHSDSSGPEQICSVLGKGRKGLLKQGATSQICIRLMKPGR